MTIQISTPTMVHLQSLSEMLNVNENILLERAIQYYISAVEKELQLKKEFKAWDAVSDESLINFDQALSQA